MLLYYNYNTISHTNTQLNVMGITAMCIMVTDRASYMHDELMRNASTNVIVIELRIRLCTM